MYTNIGLSLLSEFCFSHSKYCLDASESTKRDLTHSFQWLNIILASWMHHNLYTPFPNHKNSLCFQFLLLKQCCNIHFYIGLHNHVLFLWDRFQEELLGHGLYLYPYVRVCVVYSYFCLMLPDCLLKGCNTVIFH